MQHNAGLEVVPDHSGGLELADHYSGRDLESVDQSAGKIHPDNPYAQYQAHPQYVKQDGYTSLAENSITPQGRRRRAIPRIWYIGAALLLIIIIAAVLGGVLGSRARSGSTSSDAPATNSTTNSTGPSSSKSFNSNSTGLASIGYLDGSGIEKHRVYYQLPTNEIHESSWNDTGKTWYVSNDNVGVARSGSPLAATIGTTSQGLVTNLFYLDSSGKLSELVTTDGRKWQPGSLNTHDVFPAASTKIAAIWSHNTNCDQCPNSLLVVVQFDGNSIHLYNSTQDNWVGSNIPGNAITATGVSLSNVANDKYPDQLRFFYQIASGDLVAADWVSPAQFAGATSSDVSGKSVGWNLNEDHPLGQFPMQAPVASFSFGRTKKNVTSYGNFTGYPTVVAALMSGSRGLTATQWFPSGTNTFRPAFKPPAMDAVRNYTAVTAHAWGSAYAFNDTGIAEFVFDLSEADQSMTWRYHDTVYAF